MQVLARVERSYELHQRIFSLPSSLRLIHVQEGSDGLINNLPVDRDDPTADICGDKGVEQS